MGGGVVIRKTIRIIRILGALIDYLIVVIPVQIIILQLFDTGQAQADLLFKLLYAVYGVLFIEYMNGSTVGKWFGKIKVTSKFNIKPTLMEAGMRELTKSIYFIPYIGWALGVVSCITILFGKGTTLHDYVAGTKVIYLWDEVRTEDE